MSGLDAAARIRGRDETRSLPIIVMSAYAGKEEEKRCAELRVNVFLRKPVTASSLFDAIVESQGVPVHAAVLASISRSNVNSPVCRCSWPRTTRPTRWSRPSFSAASGSRSTSPAMAAKPSRWSGAPAKYAAILMDMQMPELDGLAATRALRADPRFATIPIIAMTANAMKVDLDACLAAGMNDHITKPVDRRALLATLRRWLPTRATLTGAAAATTVAPSVTSAPSPSSTNMPARESEPVLEGIDVRGTMRRLDLIVPASSGPAAICRRAARDPRCPARGGHRTRRRRGRPARARDRGRCRKPWRRCAARRGEGA